MRSALAPRSLRPTRETERVSTRLLSSAGVTRTTMSSLKPNQRVVSVASSRPSPGPAAGISQPSVIHKAAVETLP